MGEFPLCGPTEAVQAVQRARRAFDIWKTVPFSHRKRVVRTAADIFAAEADDVAEILIDEIGKPAVDALGAEVLALVENLRVLARRGEKWLLPRRETRSFVDWVRGVRYLETVREPLGVVGIIGTWNYPLVINGLQIASALLCGNAVVLKPSEMALSIGKKTCDIFQRAGLPEGLLQFLPGDGSTGEALARRAGCDKILFTGSSGTGRKLLSVLAETATPSVMELSGMDAALVLEDADIPRAVRALAWASFGNAGQVCAAARRVIVREKIFEEFKNSFVAAARGLRLGDPRDPETDLGPLRSSTVFSRVESLVDDAEKKGAKILTGGPLREKGPLFFAPAILTDVPDLAAVSTEEFFGPVALLEKSFDEKDMLRRAENNLYGLTATIWSRDLKRARRLAGHLSVGTVWINDAIFGAADARAPFGGVKSSGFGKVHGPEGLWELTRTKWVETGSPIGFRPHYFPNGIKKWNQLRKILAWRSKNG